MSREKQRDIELFIVDVLVSIERIQEYTKDFRNEDDFRHDSLHWDASIRQLEIIGEALKKLLENNEFCEVAPKYFRQIVNFRNIIIHGYFGIDTSEVWNVVKDKLDILKTDMRIIVKDNIDLSFAILTSIEEYNELNDEVIVGFLQKLNGEID